jgi:anti-sigma regulatory factor (Ser/Thr protein kinase)
MAEHLAIAAELGELVRVGAWAETLAKAWALPASTAFGLGLCLEEAVSNVINHGTATRLALTLEHSAGALTLTIEDQGQAFDPLAHARPALPDSIEAATIGGMGIHLMRQFARSLAYERRDGTNRLTVTFDLAPGAGAG